MRGGPRTIPTPEQREEILYAYLTDGPKVAGELSVKLGLAYHYARRLASSRGLSVGSFRSIRRPRAGRVDRPVDNDPRWNWAIERGAVLA